MKFEQLLFGNPLFRLVGGHCPWSLDQKNMDWSRTEPQKRNTADGKANSIKLPMRILAVAVAVVSVSIKGPLTSSSRYCEAFSAQSDFARKPQLSSRSVETKSRVVGRLSPTRNPRAISLLNHAMTSSDKNTATIEATKQDEDGEMLDPSTIEPINGANGETKHPPFDGVAWKFFQLLTEDMLTQKRVVKNCDEETIAKCRAFLLSQQQHVSPLPDITATVANNRGNKKDALELSFAEQSERFLQHLNYTSVEVEFINRCIVYMGDACAREQSRQNRNTVNGSDDDNALDPRLAIAVVWEKIKEMGFVLREKSMSSYMYILSSAPGNTDESSTESDDFADQALLEVVTSYDAIYTPSEKTLTIRFKSLIARGKIDEAEEIFAASFNGTSTDNDIIQGRLRTYMPLMEYYCKVGDLKSTLRLYQQMQDCPGVHWDVESYTVLLSSLARFGYFFGNKQNIERHSVDEDTLYGPQLFDSLVSNMADDILELTEETSLELAEAFQYGMKEHMGINDPSATTNTLVVDRVNIPKETGTCPLTDVKLGLLTLDDEQRKHVHDTLLQMSRKNTEEFLASNIEWQQTNKEFTPTQNDNIQVMTSKMEDLHGYKELLKFSQLLDDREGDLFTTIVDGANVAYYGHSNVHYSSLKKVVEKLESMGERPLVVMPEKYTWKKFYVRPRYYQKLTEKDIEVIDWLKEKEIIYIVPRFVLDDYFWMLASVSNQTNASQRGDLNIPVGDDQGRFPGMRPMLITNDQMRDHKLDLLKPREFRRWCSCHIVNYVVGEYKEDEWEEDREIYLVPADSFSREIQPNTHVNGKGNVWHFPIADSTDDSTDWLCIWIDV